MIDITLGELSEHGVLEIGDGYRTKRSEHGLPGFRILRVNDLHDWRIVLTGEDFVRAEFASKIGTKLSQPGDVLLSTKGTVGRVALYPKDVEQVVYSPQMCYFRVKDEELLRPRYLAYWFKSPMFSEQSSYRANGSDMAPYISLRDIRTLQICLPDIRRQSAIVEVLGALDDKIATNERVINAAQALMRTIVLSVNRRAPLCDLVNQSTASIKPDEFDDLVAHFSLPAFDDGANPEIVSGRTIKSNKFVLSEPCVLFSKLNPRIPRIWEVGALPTEMALASTEFVVLIPTSVPTSVLWAALCQPDVSEELRQMVAGTSGSHQRIRPHDLLGVKVRDMRELDPDLAELIARLGQSSRERRREIGLLARTRDELLPLLMSGKLRVKDAEAVVAKVS